MDLLHDILLWIHIPAGVLSLILFWIPVMTKKGGSIHRKVGKLYYWAMWIVQISAVLLCVVNVFKGSYVSAAFLGFLAILTAYPLWYSYEILQQKKIWTDSYFKKRRAFAWLLFGASVCMVVGAVYLQFKGAGVLMAFFGALGIPAWRDARLTIEAAMKEETRIKMHIKGTIISGIAAYTAFLAFGGRALLSNILHGYWQVLPWILPTIIGITIIRIMERNSKYANKQ